MEGGKGWQIPVLFCLKVMLCKASDSVAISQGVMAVTWYQQLEGGTNISFTVFPHLRAIPWAWR